MNQENQKMTRESRVIEEVKKHPVVFDKSHPDWKKPIVREVAWRNIAVELNTPNIDEGSLKALKKEWDDLRNAYTTYLNKLKKVPTGSGRDDVNTKKYVAPTFRHSDLMKFYEPFHKPYNSKRNVENYKQSEAPAVAETNEENSQDVLNDAIGETDEVYDECEISDFLAVNSAKDAASSSSSVLSTSSSSSSALPLKKSSKNTKKRKVESFDEKFLELYQKRQQAEEKEKSEQDEYYHFGLVIAKKLRNVSQNESSDAAFELQLKIMQQFSK